MVSTSTTIIATCSSITVISFLLILIGIQISMLQILLVAGFILMFIVIAVIYYYFSGTSKVSKQQKGDIILDAVNYAINWAKDAKHETLTFLDGGYAITRSYPPNKEEFVGLKLLRSPTSNNAGQPITMVISMGISRNNKIQVKAYHDTPDLNLVSDPFYYFSAGYSGSPTAETLPSSDLGVTRSKYNSPGPAVQVNTGQDDRLKNPMRDNVGDDDS